MMKLVVFVVFALLGFIHAELIRMEPSINKFSSRSWLKQNDIDAGDMVQAVFVMKHDRSVMEQLDKKLMEISNPRSQSYGSWLSNEELAIKYTPTTENYKKVMDFISNFGVKDISTSAFKDLIFVKMPVNVANKMLNTEFGKFTSVIRKDISIYRVIKPYYLPVEIASVVSLVDDILRFPSVRSSLPPVLSSTEQADDEFSSCGRSCNGFTTPDVLASAYSYSPVQSVAAGNSMSVAEFQMQYYDNTDLEAFSDACDVTATVDTTVGGNNEKICLHGGCVEALLDIEYIEAVANPIPLTVLYFQQYSLLAWITQVLAMPNPPLVHSVSYGNDEVQQESTEYMISVNDQFLAAANRGLSIFFAAGDQGVWGRTGVGATYHPDFPAGSPYVTAVGGTDFAEKSTIGAETTWPCGGGGFSNTFGQPTWQEAAVSGYLLSAANSEVLPPLNNFNSTGRAYPDVSALGGQVNPYCVAYKGGKFGGVAGTSASCPVVAGIFAQLNNVRLAAGKSALGFLNPFIYLNSQCFNDIDDGSQNNCNDGTQGFAALPGWDPATGVGSPNYACLEDVVKSMN